MQPALVSSTGEMEQAGMTCGGTLTDGFDGGRIPEAPAGTGAAVTATTTDPIPAARATAARASVDTARAPGWCRLTLPFAPLVRRNRPARAT